MKHAIYILVYCIDMNERKITGHITAETYCLFIFKTSHALQNNMLFALTTNITAHSTYFEILKAHTYILRATTSHFYFIKYSVHQTLRAHMKVAAWSHLC